MERQLSATIADFIEECRIESPQKFIDEMNCVHPTLQQCFVGMIFGWLNYYDDSRNDERNQASMDFVRELKDIYCNATGRAFFKDLFPFI
jgi:hypothetical protein